MVQNKSIVEQLAKHHKIIDDFEDIEVNNDDENMTLIFLISLPISFENLKDSFIYGKKGTNTLDEFQTVMRFDELLMMKDLKVNDSGENFNVTRGESDG